MDRRTKAYKLYQAGVSALGKEPETIVDLGMLLAAMICESSKSSPSSLSPRHDPEAVAFLDTLIIHAEGKMITVPFDASWYKLTEWKLRDLPLTIEDAARIGDYLAAGNWRGGTPTVKQVLNNLSTLISRCEQSDEHDPRFSV